MSSGPDLTWVCAAQRPAARLRLVIFPHAGGGTMPFRRWVAALPAGVEPWLVQLPGREQRYREAPVTSRRALVDDLCARFRFDPAVPVVFFGHSVGALIAYDLAAALTHRGMTPPVHLCVSGRRAPHLEETEPLVHRLDDPQLVALIRRLGGTPEAVLRDPEMLSLMLPVLRSDFQLNETERQTAPVPLACPVTAWSGAGDPRASPGQVEGWRAYTSAAFTHWREDGDHFFVFAPRSAFLARLVDTLTAIARLH